MDVMNGTRFALDATQAIDKAGQPSLVVLGPEASRPGATLQSLHDCFTACQQAVAERTLGDVAW
jgi:hypothetical protein